MKKICMLGSGAWGTAVSMLLADNGYPVNMWCCQEYVAKSIAEKNCNEVYFPGNILSKKIEAFTDIEQAMDGCDIIFEATPVQFLRSVLEKAKPYVKQEHIWVVLSKGIEQETLLFPSQIIDDVFGWAPRDLSDEDSVQRIEMLSLKKVVISGPSFAKDVAAKQLTAVDLAAEELQTPEATDELADEVFELLSNNYFTVSRKHDPLGLQIGGALKNIAALTIGILDGAGYTDNPKALVLTKFLHEMAQFAQFHGAQKETLCGFSGLGDLVLTCMGGLSRNLAIGQQLGAGNRLKDILSQTQAVPESVNTLESVYQMIQQCKLGNPAYTMNKNFVFVDYLSASIPQESQTLDMPLFEMVYEVVHGDKKIGDLLQFLRFVA